ncbi:c-di-GMP-binding flagellar brake protein YcgR [Sphaerotilus hippei]|uniref:C-di-GMP-binding flagellar brake protein YcgR n=1 Tax=Sphaerotilus hippei TaxID=744406 RepID=A0A318GUP1_9BURK|nr:flagellar brake protein [Sphaerotilus hippei]PXW91932.1 c-di-GMP-binding flagellar brake protein YcgR [Sphaerotilus hippei]
MSSDSLSFQADAPEAPLIESATALAAHELRSHVEIRALMRQFVQGDVPISLISPPDLSYTTSLWAEDEGRQLLSFAADGGDARVRRLLAAPALVAVGYIDNIKIQFDVQDLSLVSGLGSTALNARYPVRIYRLQRRDSYRVRPLSQAQPVARLNHPADPSLALVLRVLDVSHTGVALLLPADLPALPLGTVLGEVRLDLDASHSTRLVLKVIRIGAVHAVQGGVRLGCEIVNLPLASGRVLQRYLEQTQQRRRMLSL